MNNSNRKKAHSLKDKTKSLTPFNHIKMVTRDKQIQKELEIQSELHLGARPFWMQTNLRCRVYLMKLSTAKISSCLNYLRFFKLSCLVEKTPEQCLTSQHRQHGLRKQAVLEVPNTKLKSSSMIFTKKKWSTDITNNTFGKIISWQSPRSLICKNILILNKQVI